MRNSLLFCLVALICTTSWSQIDSLAKSLQIEANKQIVMKFYNDLWATNNTDKYAETVAERYVVHDIGERKNVTEPAIQQKMIADFFWDNGDMEFILDYQIAERDLVMTRWSAAYTPHTLFGKFL